MDKVKWIIFGAACVIIVVFLYLSSEGSKLELTNKNPDVIETSGDFADHIYGNPDAEVTLVEYADFQCPGCAQVAPVVKQLAEKYKNDLAFVYRNYPLTSSHPNALAAATAAEAAAKQGKFFEMSELLYQNQSSWNTAAGNERSDLFESYASSVGVKIDQYRKDLSSEKIKNKIERDRQFGRTVGVDATPTFVLNGKVLKSNQWNSLERFESTLLDAFKDKGITPEVSSDEQ